MRIVAGKWGGQRLAAPKGLETRPTTDRVREACFSALGEPPTGAQILDLFAGSGAMGLEALSRGAAQATFVESSITTLKVLKANISAFKAEPSASVHKGDAIRFLERTKVDSYDWIFIDPPYQSTLANESLAVIQEKNLLKPGGVIVVEHDKRIIPNDFSPSLLQAAPRRYGDTSLTFYRTPA